MRTSKDNTDKIFTTKLHEMKVFKDEHGWIFVLPDFINLQVGPASSSDDSVYSLDEVYEDLINQKKNLQ